MTSAMSTLGRSPRLGRARAGIAVLVCCCAGLSAAACSADSGTKSPGTSVTAPSVGRPAMPTSVAAAVAKEAFTPYAELGATGDGLAPNATSAQLATACMTAAGYAGDAGDVQFGIRVPGYLGSDGAPFGRWGYVGNAAAAQDGFTFGPGLGPPPATGSSGLSAAAHQQQLTKEVQQYRAAYQKELGQLPALLATTPTTSPGNGPRP